MKDYLILVDENDRQWGKLEKQLVHELGLLHRAFSVFIFNSRGELLLQQRADDKYHSGGLWTNTCCSHPRFGEETSLAASRRLEEEMGLTCPVRFAFSFTYKTMFANGLTEYEFDHVFISVSDQVPIPLRSEVKNWKYISVDALKQDMATSPGKYTVWFRMVIERVIAHLRLLEAA